jgi:hypothetical protein
MKTENFENHPLFEKLEQLNSTLQNDEIKGKISIDYYAFYETVYNYIKDRLKLTIPILVQEAEMNSLVSELDTGLSQINSFIGNNNAGHLDNANNNFNSALNRIRNFPLPFAKNDFNFSKVIATFEKTVAEKYKILEDENEKLKTELKDFENQLASNKIEIENLSKLLSQKELEIQNLNSSFQTEFNNIKNTAVQTFEQDRKTFRTEIETDRKAFTQERNAFRIEIDAEKKAFQQEREAYKKEFDSDRKTYQLEIEKHKELITTETSELINELKNKLEESKNLVNVIGNVGVTGNYQNIANHHRKQANIWRIVAVLFMSILSILLIYTIWHLTGTEFDWKVALIRVIAFSALLYPATYAAKEAGKHRRMENINRKSELDLASINPFIEILPENKKQEIKEKLVDKFFGNDISDYGEDNKKDNDELSIGGFEKLIKALLPFIRK